MLRRYAAPLLLLSAGCIVQEVDPPPLVDGGTSFTTCYPGSAATCYSGQAGTSTNGICRAGLKTCGVHGDGFGECVGEIVPLSAEDCATPVDDDCDGLINEAPCACLPGTSRECFGGMLAQRGVGICVGGVQICAADGLGFGDCIGDVLPEVEDCADERDEDCDGRACSAPEWGRLFGDASPQQFGGVATDSMGNIWIVGHFSGVLDFGGACSPLTAPAVDRDVFVAKLDPNGVCLWSERFGEALDQLGYAIAVDRSDDSVVIAGEYRGQMNLGCELMQSAGPVANIFIAKLKADGSCDWQRGYGGGDGSSAVLAVAIDQNTGDVAFAGYIQGSANFGGNELITTAGSRDAFIAKFARDATHVWSDVYGDDTIQEAVGVAMDSSGDVLVSAQFSGTIDFGGPGLTSRGGRAGALAKLGSRSGGYAWSVVVEEVLLAPASHQGGVGVVVDPETDDVFWTGYFEGTATLNGPTITGNPSMNSAGARDIFAARFNSVGQMIWLQRYGDVEEDFGISVALTPDDHLLLAGQYRMNVDFGGGPLTTDAGSVDGFLLKLDVSSGHVWSKHFGDNQEQTATDVASDAAGNAILIGTTSDGEIDFGLGPQRSRGGYDLFVAKFAP